MKQGTQRQEEIKLAAAAVSVPHHEQPFLLSNIEVLELLQKNHAEICRSLHKRWKHRNWVQSQVVEYLQLISCPKIDSSRREEFQFILRSRKLRKRSAFSTSTISPNISRKATGSAIATKSLDGVSELLSSSESLIPDSASSLSIPHEQTSLFNFYSTPHAEISDTVLPIQPWESIGFSLTQAESLQILNFMPTEAVELHLMIDDLNSRISHKQQDVLLQTISQFVNKPPRQRDSTNMTIASNALEAAGIQEDAEFITTPERNIEGNRTIENGKP